MPPRETIEPTPELKARFEKVTRGAQAEAPDFTLQYGSELLDAEAMIKHVQDGTDVGLHLLTMFAEEEAVREAAQESSMRARFKALLSKEKTPGGRLGAKIRAILNRLIG